MFVLLQIRRDKEACGNGSRGRAVGSGRITGNREVTVTDRGPLFADPLAMSLLNQGISHPASAYNYCAEYSYCGLAP